MSKLLYNPFAQKLGLEAQFESSDDESDTRDYRNKNTNITEGGNYGNGQVDYSDVEFFYIRGDDATKGFVSYSD